MPNHRILQSRKRYRLEWMNLNGLTQACHLGFGKREVALPDHLFAWLGFSRGPGAVLEPASLIAEARRLGLNGLDAGGRFTDADLASLGEWPELDLLNLSNCGKMTDAGLAALARFPGLKHLSLNGMGGITDAGLQVLARLPDLEYLHLGDMKGITDAGLAVLSGLKKLRSVDLGATATGDGALAHLMGKPFLEVVVPGLALTDTGLTYLRHFPAFTRQDDLEDISYNQFNWWSLGRVGPLVKLRSRMAITDAGLAVLGELPGLRGFELFGITGNAVFDDSASAITARGIAAACRNHALQFVGCAAHLCDDEALASIASLPRLRYLTCQDAVATDKGFTALAECRTLEILWARKCPNISDASFQALCALPSLRCFALGGAKVSEKAAEALPRFPSLKAVLPTLFEGKAFESLGHCTGLEEMWDMYMKRHETGLSYRSLKPLPHLKYVYTGQRVDRPGMEALADLESLEEVDLDYADFEAADLPLLARLPRLKKIKIGGWRKPEPLPEEILGGFGEGVEIVIED